jgi:pectate lyase
MVTTKKKARILTGILLAIALVMSFASGTNAVPAEGEKRSGTWFESAFAEWAGEPGDDGYRAYVRTLGAYDWRDDKPITGWLSDWEEVDGPLVRLVDDHRNTWRVDVPGLPRGEYEIQVRAADGTEIVHTFESLQTRSFPRNGAAFEPSDVNPFEGAHEFALGGAVGGYLPDGRVDPAAQIVYVTHQNMSTTMPADLFTAGREGAANERTPLVVRFLGAVGAFDRVAATPAEAGAQVPPGAFNNNRHLSVGSGNGNVTFEGVGPDAVVFGWGISTGGAHNVVFRNLTFDQFFDDAIEVHGGGVNVRASNIWVHNNSFRYGQNKFLNIENTDPDQAKGDGATDIVNHARNYTVSYNHYAGSSKVMLIGGGAGSMSAHYGTVHHNWFQGSEERTPRVRNGRVHVFNNLYDDIQGHPFHNVLLERHTGYGIGAGHNATIWAEGNTFEGVNFPFVRSRQGHARGHQPIDYVPGPDESPGANAGFNHFFGDAPGFIVTREVATHGDFPPNINRFRSPSDYLPGLTPRDLQSLRQAALRLERNVLDAESRTNFDLKLDIGVVVAAGSTTTNPDMTTNPPAQLDWSFRPTAGGVWPTTNAGRVAALRAEIESHTGAIPAPTPTSVPVAPMIASVVINDEVLSVGGSFIPVPKVVVHQDTFTIDWVSDDILAESYEIQWDGGSGVWQTIATVPSNARPKTFITQDLDQFANLQSILAQATDHASYAFRVRALNSAGASDWSETYTVTG